MSAPKKKVKRSYNKDWEKDPLLKDWIEPSKESDIILGKGEAFCKLCQCNLRAQHHDLVVHATRDKHKERALRLQSGKKKDQQKLLDHGYTVVDSASKICDLRLAVFIAMHCSVTTIDHLGELLMDIGKGSSLENLKIHRTKCSSLIKAVIAPALLTDLVRDIGTSDYSIICDEATDASASKFMGMCIRYLSTSRQRYVTDFLGIIEVVKCTGANLASALLEYLKRIGLPYERQFFGIGTDGAANMCGVENSMYTHLRKVVPDLQQITCICHSLDNCAACAFKTMPDDLTYIMAETSNYFAHSALRWNAYETYYKEKIPEKSPNRMVKLAKTRWMVWLPVSSRILDDWTILKGFFNKQALNKDDTKAKCLAPLYNNNCNLLYLTFLRTVLREVQSVNLAFECENPDITKIYSDLRNLVFGVSKRVLHPHAVANTARPGMLRRDEVDMLTEAFEFQINFLPTDRVNFGDSFKQLSKSLKLPAGDLANVQETCKNFLVSLSKELLKRVPRILTGISKIRHLSPRYALARIARPTLDQLPLEFAGPSVNRDLLDSQWSALGEVSLADVCPHLDLHNDLDQMDIAHFWICVSECKNGAGQRPFKELSDFVLRVLCLPVSNAVIERVFSVLACVKTKSRNKMQLKMLESILRLRVHLKVDRSCCTGFKPTKDMLNLFNCSMYKDVNDPNAPLLTELDAEAEDDAEPEEGGQAEGLDSPPKEKIEERDPTEEDYAEIAVVFNNNELNPIIDVAHYMTIQ